MASPAPTKPSSRMSLSPGPNGASGSGVTLSFDDNHIRVACRVRPPAARDMSSGINSEKSNNVANGTLSHENVEYAVR